STTSMICAVLIVPLVLIFITTVPTPLRRRVTNIEKRFINNINERENRRTGHENNLVSDLQLAYMRVGYDCPFIGDRLRNLDLRTRYGVNLVNIQRGSKRYPVPSGDMRIFPNDMLGVIGTEEQIQRLLPLVEADVNQAEEQQAGNVKFVHFAIGEKSPIIGIALENTRLREDYGALLVAVQRGDDDYLSPTPDLTFRDGDILWIVGEPKRLNALKG
ncbi:MAG: TrkA C-terminal domain-containing protein, partial [Muribaculaceae bacterium]|nr:TrkA C-terminal domain-containing protein [Muribaculaceae bacterium]